MSDFDTTIYYSPLAFPSLLLHFFPSESQMTMTQDMSLSDYLDYKIMDFLLTFLFPGDHVSGGRQNC